MRCKLRFTGLILVALVTLTAGLTPGAWGQVRERVAPELDTLWGELDIGRAYRQDFAVRQGDTRARVQQGGKSYTQILGLYVAPAPGDPSRTPKQIFLDLIGPSGFAQYTGAGSDAALRQEAEYGFQEALSEHMAGESLLANESMLQGLRTRFPRSGDPADPSQTSLLETSVQTFLDAFERAGDAIRQNPEAFRPSGTVNFDFPFFVENTPLTTPGQGDIVEAEYYRFTDLVNRYGTAANALGKRKFFFGNDDAPSRQDASDTFKVGAQAVYLGSALLAAVQSETDFQNNNGGELDRHITSAQQIFDDIQSGFNPLAVRGDFVPSQSVNGYFDSLETQLQSAVCSEIAAKDAARLYDTDATALASELRDQSENYLDVLGDLSGFGPTWPRPGDTVCAPPNQLACDLTDPEHQELILEIVDDEAGGQPAVNYLEPPSCDAIICNLYRDWLAAQIEFDIADQATRNITDQMRIEERRSNQVTRIITATGIAISAIEVAEGIAVAAVPQVTTEASLPPSVSTTFDLGAAVSGVANAGITAEEILRDVVIEQSESSATIKNLLLELAVASLEKRRAALAVVQARAQYTTSIGDLSTVMRNYVAAREELSGAYFTNPAYQLALEFAAQNAEQDFEAALINGYIAAKVLEYQWAERLANPVIDPSGPDKIIGNAAKFNPIVSAESVFTVRSAGDATSPPPMLRTFVEALQAWDGTMRSVRGLLGQSGQSRVVSLKRDVLGYNSTDQAFNRLAFRSFIASNRLPGLNPNKEDLKFDFPIQIYDQRLLPALPNLKIESIEVNLKTTPGRSLFDSMASNPPQVNLWMHGQALIRTFFADFPDDDDFLTIALEEDRSCNQSQFCDPIDAMVDGVGGTPGTRLLGRSPAVSRWELNVELDNGDNTKLLLENLDDIEIIFTYSSGQPLEFDFAQILSCP